MNPYILQDCAREHQKDMLRTAQKYNFAREARQRPKAHLAAGRVPAPISGAWFGLRRLAASRFVRLFRAGSMPKPAET
jgi:hypothetical protein